MCSEYSTYAHVLSKTNDVIGSYDAVINRKVYRKEERGQELR